MRNSLYDIELDTGEIISSVIKGIDEWNSSDYQSTQFYKNVMRDGIEL